MTCLCGSQLNYDQCCRSIHLDPKNAKIPEQLMRARYSAHALKLIDFIVCTYHPSVHAEQYRRNIEETAQLHWLALTIIDAPSPMDSEGFVEFSAQYEEDNKIESLHERSRFLFEQNQWFYIDGQYPDTSHAIKIGRNDPCPCGSGKKVKKCCY
jgi:SEC-C motif-containing protein